MIKKVALAASILLISSSIPTVLHAKDMDQLATYLREGRKLSSEDLEFMMSAIRAKITTAKGAGDKQAFLDLSNTLELVIEQLDREKKNEERRANNDENRVWRACYKKSSADYEMIEKGLVIGGFVLFAVPLGIIMWKLATEVLKVP